MSGFEFPFMQRHGHDSQAAHVTRLTSPPPLVSTAADCLFITIAITFYGMIIFYYTSPHEVFSSPSFCTFITLYLPYTPYDSSNLSCSKGHTVSCRAGIRSFPLTFFKPRQIQNCSWERPFSTASKPFVPKKKPSFLIVSYRLKFKFDRTVNTYPLIKISFLCSVQ